MERKTVDPYGVDLSQLSMADLDKFAQDKYQKMLGLSEQGPSQEFYYESVLFVRAGNEYYKRRMADEFMERYNVISDEHGTERADAILGD